MAIPSLGCQGFAVAGRADVILLLSVGSLWCEDGMTGCPDSVLHVVHHWKACFTARGMAGCKVHLAN